MLTIVGAADPGINLSRHRHPTDRSVSGHLPVRGVEYYPTKTGDTMNKKVFTLSALVATMLFGATAQAADTRIGVTIYKYDDNFMSVVRKDIEKEAKNNPGVQLLMNDSQNSQSTQNDQVDVLVAKGVKALAINLVDPAAAAVVISKAKANDIPVVFFNKEPTAKALASYDKAYYVEWPLPWC